MIPSVGVNAFIVMCAVISLLTSVAGYRVIHRVGRYDTRIGILIEVPFMSTTLYTGPVARALGGADITWIVGLIATVPIYLLACRRCPAAATENVQSTHMLKASAE